MLAFLVVLFIVATMGFVLFRILPVDAYFHAMPKDPHIPSDDPGLQELRDIYSKPIYSQYAEYIYRTFTGQFGIVVDSSFPDYHIGDFVFQYVLRSLFLFGVVSVLSILFGALYIRYAAKKPGRVLDGTVKWVSAGLLFLPVVAVVQLINAAAMNTDLPLGGFWSDDYYYMDLAGKISDILQHALLPMLTCFVCSVGAYFLILKEGLAEAARRTGQERKGAAASMLTAVPYIPFFFAWVLMSCMVVDAMDNYYGLGTLLRRAIMSGSGFPLLEAIFFLSALIVMVSSLAFDVLAGVLVRRRSKTPSSEEIPKNEAGLSSPNASEKHAVPPASFPRQILGIVSDFVHSWKGNLSLVLLSVLVVMAFIGHTISAYEAYTWPPDITKAFLRGSTIPVAIAIVIAVLSSVIGLLVGITAGLIGKQFDWFFTTLTASLMSVPIICVLAARSDMLFYGNFTETWLLFALGVEVVMITSCALVAVVVSRSTLMITEKHKGDWPFASGSTSLVSIVGYVLPRVSSDALRAAKYATIVAVLAISAAPFWDLSVGFTWGDTLNRAYDNSAIFRGEYDGVIVPMLGIALLCLTMFLLLDTAAQVLKKRYPD